MIPTEIQTLARELDLAEGNIKNTVALLEEGGTVPFIARYRKEMTGSLDEVQILAIRDGLDRLRELEKRKSGILASLTEREIVDADLHRKIAAADNLTLLEDIYLPYRPKRRTRAMAAREKGLEPLAQLIISGGSWQQQAADFVSEVHGVNTAEEALAGAGDIVAEIISENIEVRKCLRKLFAEEAVVSSHVVEKNRAGGEKFSDYFDHREPVKKVAGHRILALFRGEKLKILKLCVRPDPERSLAVLTRLYLGRRQDNSRLLQALQDSYARLLAPSLENELRQELKKRADAEAIMVFSRNLEALLLAAPLGQKRVMALDPGFRTGAKLVCLDAQGKLVHAETIYPTHGGKSAEQAGNTIRKLVEAYAIEAIAIGNGTAGRETLHFVRSLGLGEALCVTLVNEDGASIYSASEAARREFPHEDITVRGAVSIGRRLQDPLAELVKIDPKAIGVGQYQHDVNQTELRKSLEDVVMRCVHAVGVEVNSASVELLGYVAGLGSTLAANIVEYRLEKGPFRRRAELLKVKRLGAGAFEQCAGFLRIRHSQNPLDNSGVHPERYALVQTMAADLGVETTDLLHSETLRTSIDLKKYIGEGVGMETLTDIMAELAAPGRDPREKFAQFQFDDTVHTMEDLRVGMVLPAVITNVTRFGAFADLGIKQDGLIHISQMADRYVKDPAEVVQVRQQVKVKVLEIDMIRKRIGLSLLIQ
jgi:protein Tex